MSLNAWEEFGFKNDLEGRREMGKKKRHNPKKDSEDSQIRDHETQLVNLIILTLIGLHQPIQAPQFVASLHFLDALRSLPSAFCPAINSSRYELSAEKAWKKGSEPSTKTCRPRHL